MENGNDEIDVKRETAKLFPTEFLAGILQQRGFSEVQVEFDPLRGVHWCVLSFTSENPPSSFEEAVHLIRGAIEQVPVEPTYHFLWRLRECIPIVIGSRITAAFEVPYEERLGL